MFFKPDKLKSYAWGIFICCAVSSKSLDKVHDAASAPNTTTPLRCSPSPLDDFIARNTTSYSPGSCGPQHGNNKCGMIDGKQACCSVDGFCGITAEYCHPESDCSGQCWVNPPPHPHSLTKFCGPLNKGLACNPNKPKGGCCSKFGYCGDTELHCSKDLGCLSGCK